MVYTKIILDTRRKKTEKLYTVKLRITFNKEQKYYLTGYKMSEADFENTMKRIPSKKFEGIRIQLDHIELKAKSIITTLDGFSFTSFEEKFYERKNASKSIYDMYLQIINDKMSEGKIGTAMNYRCSMKSLQLFASKLTFLDVTTNFLKKYEQHLIKEGKSISTVGIYLRPLRAILNEAINNKYISRDNYPFGLKKYIIPMGRNIKKALSREEFKKIVQYMPEDEFSFEARAKDFWLLSYLCQGMNPKDLLLLRKDSIENDYIKFIRQKTKDTTRNVVEITVPLLPETKEIITRWENKNADNPFLFNFITEAMTPMDIYKTVQQFVKITNKYMALIAEKVEVQKKVTTYVARYQFSKALIDADISVEYLRQCLGHSSSQTTIRYIGSFEDTKKYDIARKHLLNF
jgi:integrase